MIFGGVGGLVRSHFTFCLSQRGRLMPGNFRTDLSLRSLAFFLVFLAPAGFLRADSMDDSARELGRKIAENLPRGETVSMSLRNASSLIPGVVPRIEQALAAELQSDGILAVEHGETTSGVDVVLSENLAGFLWTAEIHSNGASRVVFVSVPRSREYQAAFAAMPVELRSEKFWQGPERILDAAAGPDSNGGEWLVLLLADGVKIQKAGEGQVHNVAIPSAQMASRAPKGRISLLGDEISVALEPQACTVELVTHTVKECHPASAPHDELSPDLLHSLPPGKGGQIVQTDGCGGARQFLVTGAGDDTEPDLVQLYQGLRPVSEPLNFAGPVLSVHTAPETVITRNLDTGYYEAYRLHILCAQ